MVKIVRLVISASPLEGLRSSVYSSLLSASRDPAFSNQVVLLRLFILYLPVVPVKRGRSSGVIFVDSSAKAAIDSWVSLLSSTIPLPSNTPGLLAYSSLVKRFKSIDFRVSPTSLPYSAGSNLAISELVSDVIAEGIKKSDWSSSSFTLLPFPEFGISCSFKHDLHKHMDYCDINFPSSSSVIWVDTNPSSFRKALEAYNNYSLSRLRPKTLKTEVSNAKLESFALNSYLKAIDNIANAKVDPLVSTLVSNKDAELDVFEETIDDTFNALMVSNNEDKV